MTETTTTKSVYSRPRKMARELNPQGAASTPTTAAISAEAGPFKQDKAPSKISLVLDLLRRPTGVGMDELVAVTGWLPHTTRAALTGLRKKGNALTSEKVEGARRYRVVGAAV